MGTVVIQNNESVVRAAFEAAGWMCIQLAAGVFVQQPGAEPQNLGTWSQARQHPVVVKWVEEQNQAANETQIPAWVVEKTAENVDTLELIFEDLQTRFHDQWDWLEAYGAVAALHAIIDHCRDEWQAAIGQRHAEVAEACIAQMEDAPHKCEACGTTLPHHWMNTCDASELTDQLKEQEG